MFTIETTIDGSVTTFRAAFVPEKGDMIIIGKTPYTVIGRGVAVLEGERGSIVKSSKILIQVNKV